MGFRDWATASREACGKRAHAQGRTVVTMAASLWRRPPWTLNEYLRMSRMTMATRLIQPPAHNRNKLRVTTP